MKGASADLSWEGSGEGRWGRKRGRKVGEEEEVEKEEGKEEGEEKSQWGFKREGNGVSWGFKLGTKRYVTTATI